MAENKKKDRGQAAKRPAEKPGHETAVAPFDDIIDAILDANPEAVREHQERRRQGKRPAHKEQNDSPSEKARDE